MKPEAGFAAGQGSEGPIVPRDSSGTRASPKPQVPPGGSRRRFSARRWFLRTLGGSVLGVIGGAAYTRFVEPRWLAIGRHEIQLGAEPAPPLQLLHLSDLHASDEVSLSFIGDAIDLGLKLKPDLICLTGDFVTGSFPHLDGYAKVLLRLSRSAPAYACLGNHDGGAWAAARGGFPTTTEIRGLLGAAQVELLHNTSRRCSLAGRSFSLVGLGDWWADEMEPDTAFAALPAGGRSPVIVLSHNPDTKDKLASRPWNLMLCGHTHGGQLRLPFYGTPYAPVEDQNFVAGLCRWQDRWLHITRGVGNLYGVRFNCRPEVSLLTVR